MFPLIWSLYNFRPIWINFVDWTLGGINLFLINSLISVKAFKNLNRSRYKATLDGSKQDQNVSVSLVLALTCLTIQRLDITFSNLRRYLTVMSVGQSYFVYCCIL